MEEDDVIVEIRMKYAEDLEELLQCPICFERPRGSVPVCAEGHHICCSCQSKVKNCPVCNNRYKGTRSYLAESLCTKLDDILSSLLDPKHSSNTKIAENKRCVATQTNASALSHKQNLSLDKAAAIAETDKRMCRIGFCQSEFAGNCMYFHVRDFHKRNVIEASTLYDGFIKYWNFEFDLNKLYDYAINIKNMGLFFFNLFINESGDLFGNVEIVHSSNIEEQFHYTLIVVNSETEKSLGFDGPVQVFPVEDKFPFACSFNKDLFSSFFEEDSISLKNESKPFTCRLILTRLSPNENELKANMS